MRKRLAAVGLSVILGANGAGAQPPLYPVAPPAPLPPLPSSPAPKFPAQPVMTPGVHTPGSPGVFPGSPGVFPGSPNVMPVAPGQPQAPGLLPPAMLPPLNKPSAPAELPLPHPEQKMPISAMDVQVKRVAGGWEVWAGQKVLRAVGASEANARDMARVFRDLRPTEWVTIGGTKPVVEYGLTNGRPAVAGGAPDGKTDARPAAPSGSSGFPAQPLPVAQAGGFGPVATGAGAKFIQPIDLKTARVEAIRGVWCVRDDDTILFNFGTDKAGAEQAVAAVRKYGFNRVGVVGEQAQPVMSYLFVSQEPDRQKLVTGQLFLNSQIDALTRTGIPVPGVGYTGEMVKIDPKKVEARKDGAEWVVAFGPEVLGRFGATEWAAREAARTIQDARFTEFCKLGGASGLTFFLRDGKSPTRAPFAAQGRNFDLNSLKVQQVNDKWAVTEGGKHLFDVTSQQEGETVVRVLKAYGFDQLAHLTAGGSKKGITFLVKNR